MHIYLQDIKPKEVFPGVMERVMLQKEESSSNMVEVKHLTIDSKGEYEIEAADKMEYAFYVLNGRGLMQWGSEGRSSTRGRILYSDLFVWDPKGGFLLSNSGEGNLRILLISTAVDREIYERARTRLKHLQNAKVSYLAGYVDRRLFGGEDFAINGSLRFHTANLETLAPEYEASPHKDPEELLYVIRGEGEILSEGERKKVSPGTLVYTPPGVLHGIWNTSRIDDIQYLVVEFKDAKHRFLSALGEG